MAQALSLQTVSPLLSPNAGHSAKTHKNVIAPYMASFPPRRQLPKLGIGKVKAQASGNDNKDNSVEVHVNKGDQGTAVEKKPRSVAMDISPFGKFTIFITNRQTGRFPVQSIEPLGPVRFSQYWF